MKVFITGGTGFVGQELLRQLHETGHEVRALIRAGSENKLPLHPDLDLRRGDATDPNSLSGALQGCDAVIHLVGIIREIPARGATFEKLHVEATRNLLEAAKNQGVSRYLHMSANGTRENANTPYHQSKWRGEQLVRASGLAWTIFRPSLIFGANGEFVRTLVDLVRKLPVVPVFGDGQYRMSPVAVEDVARSFVAALAKPETVGQTYHCCGPASLTYDELLDAFGAALGKRKVIKLHQPLCLMKPLVALFEAVPAFPITSGQLTMLLEGNVCDPKGWSEAFGITPLELKEELRRIFAK